MSIVLPVKGTKNWDVPLNAALTTLEGEIEAEPTRADAAYIHVGGTAGGDLTSTYPNPTVAKVNGVTVTGTPSSGQSIVATSSSAASWQTVSGGGAPTGPAGGDLGSTYPNPTVTSTHLSAALPVLQGGTGASTAAGALAALSGTPLDPSVFNVVTQYGAKGDGQFVADISMSNGSAVVTSASGKFTSADVNKLAMVPHGAGTGVTTLITTVASFQSANQITLNAVNSSGTSITSGNFLWASDDTTSIQNAINATCTYASNHGAATTLLPVAPNGYFYGIGGSLITGGATKGNAQLTFPIDVTTGNKADVKILGKANGSALQHWQQLTPQLSGSTLVSFGVFSGTGTQNSSINANGNACVIGGPSQPGGYGISPGIYSNMMITLEDMSILTTHSLYGIGYSAFDFSGVANANLINFAIGTTGNVPGGDYTSPAQFANGAVIGGLMPANGNNDNCKISNFTIHGGYTWGLFATEHSVIDSARILYCWSGLCPVGLYFGSVGSTHGIWVNQISIEGCTNEIEIIGAGSAGIGPFIHIDQLDTESSNPTFIDNNSGVGLNAALGYIRLTGLYTTSAVNVSHPTGLKIINGQSAYPSVTVTGNYSVLVTDDTIYADATSGNIAVTLISAQWTPNTYTIVKVDSSGNTVTVTPQGGQTINGASSVVLSAQYQKVKVAPKGGINTVWFEV